MDNRPRGVSYTPSCTVGAALLQTAVAAQENFTAVDGKIEKGDEASAGNALNCRGSWIRRTRTQLS